MVLRMAKHAKRDDSSQLQFRQRIPTDVLERVRGQLLVIDLPAVSNVPAQRVPATIGNEVKFSLRTRDGDSARVLRLHALAILEKRWQAAHVGPATLSHKQLVALAGEVCQLFIDRFEENPGTPDNWAAFRASTGRSRKAGWQARRRSIWTAYRMPPQQSRRSGAT